MDLTSRLGLLTIRFTSFRNSQKLVNLIDNKVDEVCYKFTSLIVSRILGAFTLGMCSVSSCVRGYACGLGLLRMMCFVNMLGMEWRFTMWKNDSTDGP